MDYMRDIGSIKKEMTFLRLLYEDACCPVVAAGAASVSVNAMIL